MHSRVVAIRSAAIGLCALTLLAAACSSSGGHTATPETSQPTAAAVTSTTDLNNTPNSIPYVVGEQIGLPNGWTVRVAAVHYPASIPGLAAITADERYVVIDLTMQNDGTANHHVAADALFTLTDSLHKSHFVIPRPGAANGIDGKYAPGAKHSGTIIFTAPKRQQLGLILAGPRIGTKLSFFTIDPRTVSPDQT